ncbi:hypothetical protein [Enhygromyxa salina]|uniref:hypothetical protein n=1 Tax=Enhygromyxa salina TaxID=215803 RepID=UPI0011B1E22A|nr:hypothetical protein [Enhygromyxa salina]
MVSPREGWAAVELDEFGAVDSELEQEGERDEQDEDADCASVTAPATAASAAAGRGPNSEIGPRADAAEPLFRPPIV